MTSSNRAKVASSSEHQFALAHLDPADASPGGGKLDFAEQEQIVNRPRPLSETVAPIAPKKLKLFGGRDFSQMSVGLDAERGVADVGGGKERGHELGGAGGEVFALVGGDEIEPHFHLEPGPQFFAFQLRNGLLQQLAVKIEPDRDDVTALRGAKDAARAANLQVAHRDAEARA